ncbi:MAG: hypothetical protein JOZ62_16565 [Acidobacteriaceae bacterium]|nr:hypothetical protein [Acidobacteriaceae bacterium]
MSAAWLLTVLALSGIGIGAVVGQSRGASSRMAAAGGGVLSGMCLFWLIPEIAHACGWPIAFVLVAGVCGALVLLDAVLIRAGHSPRQGLIGPLLAATAVHSFLDGWSVRAVSVEPLANIAVPIGLALHKLPEGVALGWISRKPAQASHRALMLCGAAEVVTVAGAWIEPHVRHSGVQAFGSWWSAAVLGAVAGSFLFVGIHALLPERRNMAVVAIFLASFASVAALALLKVRI